MKVIVLGGAGDMGGRAVEDLADSEDVSLVTIADRDMAAAYALTDKLSGKDARVDCTRIDANNHDDLVQAMKGYDVAASALGPFHRYEDKLVHAAIDAGVDYASICDEWEAAEAVMNEFDYIAREKGRVILTGLGTSPGLSNVGVRYLSGKMEKLNKVEIYVFQPIAGGGGEAVLRHMFHIMSGDVAVWRNGKRTLVKALSEERYVEFPKFGRLKLWNMGHSEPATVPRFFDGVEEVNFYMGFGKGSSFIVEPAKRGLFNFKYLREALVRIAGAVEKVAVTEPEHGAVRIDAWGEIDGRQEHHTVCGIGQMRQATGLSLSVGAQMLAKKQLITEEPGVYAPEACLDPLTFLRQLNNKGIDAYEDLEMTRRIE